MSTSNEVTRDHLADLLANFEKKAFEAASCEEGSFNADVTDKCEFLFKKDYTISELNNSNGVLCPRYPARIFIPESEHGYGYGQMLSTLTPNTTIYIPSTSNTTPQNTLLYNTACSNDPSSTAGTPNKGTHSNVTFASSTMQQQTSPSNTTNNTIYENQYDTTKIKELVTMAKYARCRQRFVVPVIMYRGKCICRSATISINAETYGRKVVDYAYDYITGMNYTDSGTSATVDDENNDNSEDSLMNEPSPFTYEEVIKSDIQLLKSLNVTGIVDLMVEKKKIKYFMTVSSSEKADPENHYEDFNILSLPYPGCEFFKKFRENDYMATDLHYSWHNPLNDAPISVPKLRSTADLNINWDEYKSWDLVLITQNYLKVCLKYIQEENDGLLIHCISGWDRTPLFISLLRLSLWADGLIHQSLTPTEITYFTVAYDWYLFGHQLPDRRNRGEDIMFFCFYVLKHLYDDEFSIVEHRRRIKTTSSSGSAASVIILKSDCCDDDSREDLNLSYDQDSNESFSNLSNCDIPIIENYYTNTSPPQAQGSGNNPFTNRSPNSKSFDYRTKTSPISVPGTRNESTSYNAGEWNFVTETGSLDSTKNCSLSSHYSNQHDSNGSNTPRNSSNSALNNSKEETSPPPAKTETQREQRLSRVRTLFINTYARAAGLKFRDEYKLHSRLGSALQIF